jgi:type IV pilus assembly protein PilC
MVTPGQLKRRAALFQQLAATISAGVPLTKAVEMAARNRSAGFSRAVLEDIAHQLQEGHTFTDAMQLAGQKKKGVNVSLRNVNKDCWLSDFDRALLSAGEESGQLDQTFKVLANYYAANAKIIRDTIARSLPMLATLHVFFIVFPLTVFISFVLGIVDNNFRMCLPFLIDKLIRFGVLYGVIIFFIFSCRGSRGEGWRALVESIFNFVPLLGKALKYLRLARLSCALEALTNAGVPIVRAWDLAGAACGSPRLVRQLRIWAPQLETGVTPAEMVSQIKYFPEMFSDLYHTGEISGKTDETLGRLHTYFEDEGFNALQLFTKVMTGIIYALIVFFVARAIIGFYTGYYSNLLNSV